MNSTMTPLAGPAAKSLPFNLDAERSVLGSILLEPKCLQLALPALRRENSFHSPAHQAIWSTMVELDRAGTAIDVITLPDALQAAGRFEKAGGHLYLARIINEVPCAANFEYWLAIVRDDAFRRDLHRISLNAAAQCLEADTTDPLSLLDGLQAQLNDLALTGAPETAVMACDLMPATMRRILHLDKAPPGILSGYRDLDELLGGFKPGEMLVLAARPSIGKTTLAMNIAAHIALDSAPRAIGVFSLEMDSASLMMRLALAEAQISPQDCKLGLQHTQNLRLGEANEKIKRSRIAIDDSSQITILELRAKARRLKEKHGIDFIIIDYLQLMRGTNLNKNANREQEVSQISAGLKALAKELKLPILVLAQLNRQSEQQNVGRPKLSHLRESGAIEQDADVVLLLHRDRDEQQQPAPSGEPRRLKTELIVAKNRNGATGSVELSFIPDHVRFDDKSPAYGVDPWL